ncbi:AMP-dependent synthetase/ligase [Hoyosella altamirensis]|uniref:Long-subunit acyl-CoA synthetase (AMP-forming) n=1 Tax=Hoyosella altamirensis TaxID=616997 RepID=A0A839RKB6_9ACTN|nr:long-chain fatty acid--CoA ligase [Hoyosella altamirensis]MBB3036668.1 long-subunit acyl-CoA synthetase (AMP-forming) [Hoyosella altamirensis]
MGTTNSETLCAAFQAQVARIPGKTAVRTADGSVSLTWRDYGKRVQRMAAGLAALGVKHGDTVGMMLTNRPEFHVADTAILHLGAGAFSVYNSSPAEQIQYIFRNADNRVVICEPQFLDTVRQASEGTAVEHIVCVDSEDTAPAGTMSLSALDELGDPTFDFGAAWRAVQPSDLATIIYTSGTTGPPKGVELTHANLMTQITAVETLITPEDDDTVISYLPDAHAANRIAAHYRSVATGTQVITVDDPKKVIEALIALRPTIFGAVPAIWYKLKARLDAALAAETGVKKSLALWALATGTKVATLKSDGKSIPPLLAVQHRIADKLVLSKFRERLGMDNLRVALSGAAPIAPDVMAFVLGLGLPVSEVWGMSETALIVTYNPLSAPRIGTVGTTIRGMRVALADDGEVLVKGPQIMRGYRGDPEKTAEAIDSDGWLHTGDLGQLDSDGYLTIIDRKKEIIINAAGKNMAPSNIEGMVKVACPLAGSVVAVGDNQKYIVALITLDPDAAAAFAEAHGISNVDPAELSVHPDLVATVQAGIDAANARLSRVEQIKKFTILPTFWEPGSEELTPTMKLKRKPIAKKYSGEIEALYR